MILYNKVILIMPRHFSFSTILFGVSGLIIVGLIAYAVTRERMPSVYDEFAQCLTQNGVAMYGAWWCPHCQNQKKLFGTAFDFVKYIECSPGQSRTMTQECVDAGIEGYPTWKLADGTKLSGEQMLETLAEKSACSLSHKE